MSWLDWDAVDEDLLHFTRGLIALRRAHRVFRRRRFFQGRAIHGTGCSDIAWFTPAGEEMEDSQWDEAYAKSLGVFLNGEALERGRRGEEYTDDSFLLLFNAHHEAIDFTLPAARFGERWIVVIDTRTGDVTEDGGLEVKAGEALEVESRSVIVLRREEPRP